MDKNHKKLAIAGLYILFLASIILSSHTVLAQSACGGHADGNSCGADADCEWCTECSDLQYSGGTDRCVDTGTCAYSCSVPQCGATCASAGDCTVVSQCSAGTYETRIPSCAGCACDYGAWTPTGTDSDNDGWDNECELCDNEPALQTPQAGPETQCKDGIDNDCDGVSDCADSDCVDKACGDFLCGGTCTAGGVCSTSGEMCADDCADNCFRTPDSKTYTWDYAPFIIGTCSTKGLCSKSCSYTHYCSDNDPTDGWPATPSYGVCGAQCDQNSDCAYLSDQCNEGICSTDTCACVTQPKNEGLTCDDGLFCNVEETCQTGTCSGGTSRYCGDNDLQEIATCSNDPDTNPYTWDSAPAYTSTCDEQNDQCTTETQIVNSVCDSAQCQAECDGSNPCTDTCNGDTRSYSGQCLTDCTCSYSSSEDCNLQDDWYDTATPTQWVSTGQCTEKEQKEQIYRDYTCSMPGAGCTYIDGQTRWEDTGTTQDKQDGLACDDGLFCTVTETCQTGTCTGGTPKDCSDKDLQEKATCTSNPDNNPYTYDTAPAYTSTCNEDNDECTTGSYTYQHACRDDDPGDGLNDATCAAPCDQDSDCINTCDNNVWKHVGICTAGCSCSYSEVNCDDGNPCTTDSCDPATGCSHTHVDNLAPETNKTYGEPFVDDGTYHFIHNSTGISLSAADAVQGGCESGVDKIHYKVLPLTVPPEECIPGCQHEVVWGSGWQEYTTPFSIGDESCHIIGFFSTDNNGNIEEDIKRQCVFVDTTAPKGTKTVGDPKIDGSGIVFTTSGTGTAGWSQEQTHSGFDAIKMTTVTTDDQGRARLPYTGLLGGISTFSYWSNSINAGTEDQLSVWPSFYLDNNGDGQWVYADGDFYLQCEPYYTYGNPPLDAWTQYDVMNMKCEGLESPDCPHSAPTFAQYLNGEAATMECPGHPELGTFASREYGSLPVVKIDMRAGYGGPWANFEGFIDDIILNADTLSEPEWWVQDHGTEITLSCQDQDPHPVGNESVCYKVTLEGTPQTDLTAQACGAQPLSNGWCCVLSPTAVVFQEDSLHSLEYYCADAFGNANAPDLEYFTVDSTPPTTTKTIGEPNGQDYYWITTATPITLEAVDGGAEHAIGVNTTYYRHCLCGDYDDGCPGGWLTYTGPFMIPEDSCHNLEYYSVDLLENQEATNTQEHNVDSAPPTVQIDSPTQDSYVKGQSLEINGSVQDNKCISAYLLEACNASACDTLSTGTANISGTLATWDTTTKTDGPYTLRLAAQDCVGTESTTEIGVTVDNTPPTITGVTHDPTQPKPDQTVTISADIDVPCSPSGATLHYRLNSGEWMTMPMQCNVSFIAQLGDLKDGNVVEYFITATDNAGNSATEDNNGTYYRFYVGFAYLIDLMTGWNLIGLPVTPDDSAIATVLQDVADGVDVVWTYDAATDSWSSYRPDAEPGTNSLTEMETGYAYWLQATQDAELKGSGSLILPGNNIPPQRTLVPGWNMIGYYGTEMYGSPPSFVGERVPCALYSLVNNQALQPGWSKIYDYDKNGKEFHSVSLNSALDPYQGLWILMGNNKPDFIYGPGLYDQECNDYYTDVWRPS
ncbi:MAG: hypothetical protein ABIC95_05825 [archaeon]